jgi:hypothetical protein
VRRPTGRGPGGQGGPGTGGPEPGRPLRGQPAEQGAAAQLLLAAALLDDRSFDLLGQARQVVPLGGEAGLDPLALRDQAGLQALLALALPGQLGGEGLELALEPRHALDGRAVGADDPLLVGGGGEGLVDALGPEELAEGGGRAAGVGDPEPPAELTPGGLQPPPRGVDPPLGPLLLGAGAAERLTDLVVVLDQALDPRVHPLDDPLHPRRLGPQPDDLVRRRLPPRRGVSGPLLDAAHDHAGAHHHRQGQNQAMPKHSQGEVPPDLGAAESATFARPNSNCKYPKQIPVRVRPTLPEITN